MSLTRPLHPARVAIVALVGLVVVNIAIWGAQSQVNGPAAPDRPNAIVQLEPEEGQLTLPQGSVAVQIRTDFYGQLVIDSHVIPVDQTTGDPNLGEIVFRPGPDQEFREFVKGSHSAVVEWWPREFSTPEKAKAEAKLASYSWSFKVG